MAKIALMLVGLCAILVRIVITQNTFFLNNETKVEGGVDSGIGIAKLTNTKMVLFVKRFPMYPAYTNSSYLTLDLDWE